MNKSIIQTSEAPAAIGTYSQAVQVDHTVYMSGQIGLDPASMQLVDGVDAPSGARVGETVELTVRVRSTIDTTGTLRLLAQGRTTPARQAKRRQGRAGPRRSTSARPRLLS